MMKKEIILLFKCIPVLLLMTSSSCKKDWLDAKPDKSLEVPEAIKDYQALLDNTSQTFNLAQSSGFAEMSAGDFYLLKSSWESLFSTQEKSAYTWAETSSFYKGEENSDWANAYKRILITNIVLDGIKKIKPEPTEAAEWNNVKGSALFFRAFDFFNLAQVFCKSYQERTADSDPGLPLRLDYNVNIVLNRSSVRQTYNQITGDLKIAAGLLGTQPLYKTRPSKQAAFALLARTFLAMEHYEEAFLYADSALQLQSELINYAALNPSATYPMAKFNKEVIFHNAFSWGIFNASRLLVDRALYASYAPNDCRRLVYFAAVNNGVTYKGSYSGDRSLFGGLATDEMYLIRAECNARKNVTAAAMEDLNLLLKHRWKDDYLDLTAGNGDAALKLILAERRKELIYRGLRWSDLRRLNRDQRFAITLTRVLGDVTYTLSPNDKRYVFPIDERELGLSGISQNDR